MVAVELVGFERIFGPIPNLAENTPVLPWIAHVAFDQRHAILGELGIHRRRFGPDPAVGGQHGQHHPAPQPLLSWHINLLKHGRIPEQLAAEPTSHATQMRGKKNCAGLHSVLINAPTIWPTS